jgi:hypothetical protein
MIAVLYARGGFDLVLGTTAMIALGFVIGTELIAVLVKWGGAPARPDSAGGVRTTSVRRQHRRLPSEA